MQIRNDGEVWEEMEFRDLKIQYQILKHDIDFVMEKVMSRADFISGKEVKLLEGQLAEYVGVKHCITCGNGTDALSLALMAWGIGEGDAVFVPDFTFFSTGEAPMVCGATPVFVDVDKTTFNISAQALEQAIQWIKKEGALRPKVIIAVDLFGQPADYDALREIAEKYGLLLLEDGAQGFGGSIRKQKACSFGDISTTSFFPSKPLGCYGDGGAVFTDNDEWAELIRSLCVHGKGKDKYDNIRIGMNSRLDTLQAAILQVKLWQFNSYELQQVNAVARWYGELFDHRVIIPHIEEDVTSSWAQYTIVCEDKAQRERLQKALKAEGVPTMVYYAKGLHEQKAFADKYVSVEKYDNTQYLKDRALSLPIHPYLRKEQVKQVVELIQETI